MSKLRLSDALRRIAPSPTMAITQTARAMRAAGRDVISLSAGEPDFGTPAHIAVAAMAAIQLGETRYTTADGTPALKKAICAKFKRDQGLEYDLTEVTATSGGKFLIYAAMMATLNPRDEVIIPAPYWVSYPDIVRMVGGRPVIVEASQEAGFLITPAQLEAAITVKTRWVFLNSPSNPTGAIYSAEELEGLAEVLREHPQVWVLTDDIYEHIAYNAAFNSLLSVAPDLKDRTLIVNGASKAYAMTGWRLGFGAGPVDLIVAIRKFLGQTTSNPCSITQAAGIAALNGTHDFLRDWVAVYRARRDRLVAALNEIDGVECAVPQGAFYVYPKIAGLIGKTYQGKVLESDVDVASALLKYEAVACVPGTAFGLAPHLRLSFAADDTTLAEGLRRIVKFAEECQ